MSWGNRIKWNTREREVGEDKNALQALQTRDRANVLYDTYGRDNANPFANPGYSTRIAASPSGFPLLGDVISGLTVNCDNAGFLLVDPGTVALYTPLLVTNGDDSPYVVITDPGVTSSSVLTFTANSSGSVRWDLVEVIASDGVTAAQESRDIYDNSTRTFSGQLVDKRLGATLTYRIRTGTAGAGIPANDSGWLPIAAIHVNSGATGFNQCDVYDVRPLVSDRSQKYPGPRNFSASASLAASVSRCVDMGWYVPGGGASGDAVTGYSLFEGYPSGYFSGGNLIRSAPSSIADFGNTSSTGGDYAGVNFAVSDNLASGTSLSANAWYTLVALFPNNLPRWVRYAQSGSGRKPNGPRGILQLVAGTSLKPRANGVVSDGSIVPSAICGIGVACYGVALAHFRTGSDSHLICATASGKKVSLGNNSLAYRSDFDGTITGSTDTANFAFTMGTSLPSNLASVHFAIGSTITSDAAKDTLGVDAQAAIGDPASSPIYWRRRKSVSCSAAHLGGDLPVLTDFEIPIVHNGIGAVSAPAWHLSVVVKDTAAQNITACSAAILGWSYA